MCPFKDFNFFIGSNNSGKSTVLNFIHDHITSYTSSRDRKYLNLSPLEQHRGKVTGQLAVAIGVPADEFIASALKSITSEGHRQSSAGAIETIASALIDEGSIWLRRDGSQNDLWVIDRQKEIQEWRKVIGDGAWNRLWQCLTNHTGGGLQQHWVPETLKVLARVQSVSLPPVRMIPALRQIGKSGTEFNDFSGGGLIDRLAEIQSPDHDKRHERNLFDKINMFLQQVTGKYAAHIEIPHDREHVLVHMDNKVLPLSSLGMGIHEVIMIAAFCTITEGSIVCIEEPEIHMHPILQRELVSYLNKFTSNQYFIATHSASFIDTPGAAIFHVRNDSEQTRIQESILKSDRHNICVDLGYKASDIVQSNAVIWVEGPSDRIYIKHWISTAEPGFIEGVHYSIMFYGGRLLSHLSADSDEIKEFIGLRSLNQHLALVMDSDKPNAAAKINETKRRLKEELSAGSGLCWITKGREIENYVEHAELQRAVKKLYTPVYDKPAAGGAFDHALFFYRTAPTRRRRAQSGTNDSDLIEEKVDKVRVAKLICEKPADFAVMDLKQRVYELTSMIRKANA
ncbi:ATP-binding protein [Mesorhizobium hawassense]|uniref:ATP-binding protein n=2 Tax=Mesorhizobium hawassense TaxID=1209954 RepID=A0A330HTX8_9HYPH|nr:ATP-binding protein [Mesorhizobium hawassense]